MSVKLPCGCKDTVMCAQHEAEWQARHKEANTRQAGTRNTVSCAAPVQDDDWTNS